jgi:putative thioredoxin
MSDAKQTPSGLVGFSAPSAGAPAPRGPSALGAAPGGAPQGAAGLIKDGSTRTFMDDVIKASREVPVIVDFWAPWCGPCKQLGPALEKAVTEARGAVRLVKIDIDRNPEIAQQMRIQSIPAVYAFKDGRPVDGFVGALPDSQVKTFVKRLAELGGGAPDDGLEDALAEAKAALEAGDAATASAIYDQILEHVPDSTAALAGLARAHIALGEADKARAVLDKAPADKANDPEIASVRAQLELAAAAPAQGEVAGFKARLASNANDHEARYELANALFAQGQREPAVDELLELVRRDRKWNEEAARKQLVKLFEAMGPTDELTVSARRRLSSLLFS